jgi:hypothetical protein
MAATTTVRRRDRLYVSRAGRTVGWYDLGTGSCESAPGAEAVVRAAVDDWVRRTSPLRRRPLPAVGARPHEGGMVRPRAPRPEETVPTLAVNEPGAAAARRARDLLDLAARPRRRLLGRPRAPQDALPWLQAAHGQRLVGLRLATLDATWHVWHAAPLGTGSVVDHVVVGPAGVAVVTTRSHSAARAWLDGDRLRVGGQPKTYVRDARRRADAVEALVRASGVVDRRVPVHPVLVLVGPRAVDVRARGAAATVLLEDELVPWLQERPAVLATSDVRRLALTLSDARRWASAAQA